VEFGTGSHGPRPQFRYGGLQAAVLGVDGSCVSAWSGHQVLTTLGRSRGRKGGGSVRTRLLYPTFYSPSSSFRSRTGSMDLEWEPAATSLSISYAVSCARMAG